MVLGLFLNFFFAILVNFSIFLSKKNFLLKKFFLYKKKFKICPIFQNRKPEQKPKTGTWTLKTSFDNRNYNRNHQNWKPKRKPLFNSWLISGIYQKNTKIVDFFGLGGELHPPFPRGISANVQIQIIMILIIN